MNSSGGKAQGNKKANDGLPAASPIVERAEGNVGTKPAQREGDESSNSAKWERRQYRVQATIAVVGALSVVIYGFQLYEMRKATEATTVAAKAAQDAVELARESAQIDQRAWVVIKAASFDKAISAGDPHTLNLVMTNIGKTPANNVDIYFWTAISDETDPDKLPRPESSQHPSQGVAAPNVDIMVPASPVKLNAEQVAALTTGTLKYFAYGHISYRDVFGKKHTTKFCLFNYPTGGQLFAPYGACDYAD